MKPTSFTIKLRPYPFNVLFSFNQSDEEFKKAVKKVGGKDGENDFFFGKEGISCMSHDRNTYETTVRFTGFKRDAVSYGCLVHEIFHVVELVFSSASLPHDIEHSSEAYAYLYGWIAEKVFKKIGIK